MNKPHILAIDDERVILDSIIKLCGGEGWHVDDAIDGDAALKKLSAHSYDLVISDIMLPDTDGFEILNYMQKNSIKSPVIITTGFTTVENAVKSLKTGAVDYLPKPFTYEELISCLSRGLKLGEILKLADQSLSDTDAGAGSITFAPCPSGYKRLGYYSWTYPEDEGVCKIGITDILLHTIESITGIEFMKVNDETVQGNACLQIETEDQLTHSILSPLSGRIVECNKDVEKEMSLVEKDPYFKGWLYSIIPGNLEQESDNLVNCSSDRL